MRLSFLTLFVSFLSFTFSVATNPQFLSRHDRKRSPVPSVISSRQYHVPRSLLDLCINIHVNLFADVGQLPNLESILGPLDLLSKLHLCLCLKDLDIYLATNSEIQSLIRLLGPNIVSSRIRAIISTSPHAQECTFPKHAHHTCNTKDPCHWACDEGYVLDGGKCVCAPPFISCNGVCDLFPKGCSSAVSGSFNIRTHSISTLSQAKASCKSHETVCGITGHENSLAFECIDTSLAKDSCGGCMAPHPFSDPPHEVSGQDCTRIPNARRVGCSYSRCLVTSCHRGWIPNANNTLCTVELAEASRRPTKRSDIDVTANIVVDSDIITRLVAVVDAVLHLSLPSSASSTNVTTTVSYSVPLLNDVNTAAANLVSSHTIRAFLQNVDHLLAVCSSLKSWMPSCGCVSNLGLLKLVEEIDSLVAAVTELRTFCYSHPVVSDPRSPTVLPPSATGFPDRPLVIRPSDLLSGLHLNGEIVVGLHDTSLLSVLGLGLDGRYSNTNSDLLDKIAALVHLVINLQDDLTALPLVGLPNSVDVELFVSIGQVTKNLLNATTVSDVMASLGHLVAVSNASVQILENCGCIDSLDLQLLHSNLKHILDVALDGLTWCQRHPVVPGSNTPPLAIKKVPVIVGLLDRLNLVTLDSIEVTATLGGSLSNTANGLVDSFGIAPHNAKRNAAVEIKARNLVDPNLLSCLEVLVNLVAKLQVSITLTSSVNQPCVGSAELALVKKMVRSLTCITPSTTLPAVLINVNQILVAESSLEQALYTCPDAGTVQDLVELLLKITKVTLQLGDLCGSSKTTSVHRSTALLLPTASRSVRSITSRPPSHTPTTTTPFSVTVGYPTAKTSPTAIPIGPASSDDEIIVSLNHLLTTLGLGGTKDVTGVEGLGHELNEPVNRLLDGLQVGSHDLRRRGKRQVVRPTLLALQPHVDALVDLFIALVGECGTTNCTNLGIPQRDFLDASLQKMVGVLTATSWSKFIGVLDLLATTSVDALKLLDHCECIAERKLDGVYRYMTGVVDVSLALQRLCRQMDAAGTRVGDVNGQPMVVGLTRLLNALGIEGRRAVVLNGIGGGGLSRQ